MDIVFGSQVNTFACQLFARNFVLSLHNHFLISFQGNFFKLTFDFASFDEWFGKLYVNGVNPQKFWVLTRNLHPDVTKKTKTGM